MKKNIFRISFIFLFCLICIISCNFNIFAADFSFNLDKDDGTISGAFSRIKGYYCRTISNGFDDLFQIAKSSGYIPKIKVTGKVEEESPIYKTINGVETLVGYEVLTVDVENAKDVEKTEYLLTEFDESIVDFFLELPSREFLTFSFLLDNNSYTISCHPSCYLYEVYAANEPYAYEIIRKDWEEIDKSTSGIETKIQDRKKYLVDLSNSCIEGIIGGSVGAGYNVGVPYTTSQKPLADLMTPKGGGYDFNEISSLKVTLFYYYSPLFGKMYVEESGVSIPTTQEEWITYGRSRVSDFIVSDHIKIDAGFEDYIKSLSEEIINDKGEKITDKRIENGVKRFAIEGSTEPKSVLSYNIEMAVPQFWDLNNGIGSLYEVSLKHIDGYVYCLYNDNIYVKDSDMKNAVAFMGNLCNRKSIYMYNQDLSINEEKVVKTGIVLIGSFSECVVDTSMNSVEREKVVTTLSGLADGSEITAELTSNLYLTGRKINFSNGYSDKLNFEEPNVNLMSATMGRNSDAVAYSPSNVSFPIPGAEIPKFNLYNAINLDLLNTEEGRNLVEKAKEVLESHDDVWMLKYINNVNATELGVSNLHGPIPKTCKAVRMIIGFGPIGTAVKKDLSKGTEEAIFSFYIVRNNNYIEDESLISWLKTSDAKSEPYVKAEKLLSIITGNFMNKLTPLTYNEWLQMQEIKTSLQNDKDRWLVSVFNITSIILGTFLILFAILFLFAYWFDIFNTFIDFSILQFVSFGHLYPIEDKELIGYVGNLGENTKYVTFADVLRIAIIMMAFGLIFLNLKVVVSFIVGVYNYILFLFSIKRG